MTIPMTIPFGGRRLVFSMSLFVAPVKPAAPKPTVRYPEAVDATDHDLARLNRRAEVDADRRRWQAQAIFHGVQA